MDEKLEKYLEELNTPHEALAQARERALRIKRTEQKRRRKWAISFVAAAVICLFILSIRVSPTIAHAVGKVPGLQTIVELITHNKGFEDVLEHGYNEKIYATTEQANIKVVIEEVVADETGMFIMYRLSSEQDLRYYKDVQIKVFQNGEPVKAIVTYSNFIDEETYEFANTIEIASSEGMDYSQPNFEVHFKLKDETIQVPFTLKNEIKKAKVYTLNEQLEIEGQRFTVNEVRISPLRVGIEISIDPMNDKRILSFNSLELLDENKEVWGKISNGISGAGSMDEHTMTHYLQSNYFREPKSLTLKIAEVEALPKGEDYIKVDFKNQQVVFAPDFIDLSKVEVYPMQVRVQYKPGNMKHHRQLFGKAVDATGEQPSMRSSSMSDMEDNHHEATISYDLDNVQNPIKIYFSSYPTYLNGTAEVTIPLQDE